MPTQMVHHGEALRRIQRGEDADALALAAYQQLFALLDDLTPPDWQAQTSCRAWTVRDTVVHLLGCAGIHASVLELRWQRGRAEALRGADDDTGIDALTALHRQEHESVTDAELLDRLRQRAPRAVAGRVTRSEYLLSSHVPTATSRDAVLVVPASEQVPELGNIMLARDVWLHRLDIAAATGREARRDPTVDEAILSDTVADWQERHDCPVDLELTGPFGGRFTSRREGAGLRLDAIDFCRVVTGRAPIGPVPDSRLLLTRVPI